MGYLKQASASVANSKKITISTWAERLTSDSNITLMEWGDRLADIDPLLANRIALRTDGVVTAPGNAIIWAAFSGVRGSQTRIANLAGDSSNSHYIAAVDYANDFGDAVTPTTCIWSGLTELSAPGDLTITSSLNSKTAIGKPFHLYICIDMSTTEQVFADDSGNYNTGWCFINGENHGNGLISQPEYPGAIGPGAEDGHIPGKLFTSVYSSDAHPSRAEYWPGDLIPSPTDPAHSVVPGWNIGISGFEFGFPTTSAGVALNPGIKFWDTQVYVGKCILPTSENLAKFVKLTGGGHGTLPDDRQAAAKAFGNPTYWFAGKKDKFIINQGTGGSVVEIGTITDIPLPTF